jgi:hypothetical protein
MRRILIRVSWALAIGMLFCSVASAVSVPQNSGITMQQVGFDYPGAAADEPNSSYAEINLDFAALGTSGFGAGYINVVSPAGWVVQNLPVTPGNSYPGISTYFDLGLTPGTNEPALTATVDWSPSALTAAPAVANTLYSNTGGNFTLDEVNDLEGDGANRTTPPASNPGAINFGGGATSITYQPGHSTNVEQDVNQCGPASVANSLDYLRNRYGINVPAAQTNTPGVRNNQGNSIVGRLDDTMDRNQGDPIGNHQFITGKLRYLKNNNVQGLSVEFVGGDADVSNGGANFVDNGAGGSGLTAQNDGKVTAQWILDQLAKGQDVEMNVRWTGPGGGGHWVDLIAGGTIAGVPWVAYINDANQGFNPAAPPPGSGGNTAINGGVGLFDGGYNGSFLTTDINGNVFFRSWIEGSGARVNFAVAESPVPEPGAVALVFTAGSFFWLKKRKRLAA